MRRFIETQCIWCNEDIYNDETVHYVAGGNSGEEILFPVCDKCYKENYKYCYDPDNYLNQLIFNVELEMLELNIICKLGELRLILMQLQLLKQLNKINEEFAKLSDSLKNLSIKYKKRTGKTLEKLIYMEEILEG